MGEMTQACPKELTLTIQQTHYKNKCEQEDVGFRLKRWCFLKKEDCPRNKKRVTVGQAQGSDKQDDNVEHRTLVINRLRRGSLSSTGRKARTCRVYN